MDTVLLFKALRKRRYTLNLSPQTVGNVILTNFLRERYSTVEGQGLIIFQAGLVLLGMVCQPHTSWEFQDLFYTQDGELALPFERE